MSFNTRLSEVAEVVMGQSPKGDEVNDLGIGTPLLNGPTEFTNRYPEPVQFTNNGKKFAEKGDILFCVRGSTTGRMNYANQQYAIGRGIGAIRGKNGYPTPYVRALLEQNLDRLLQLATGSTFPNVGRDTLANFEVNSVDLEAANAINRFLVSIEEKIYTNSQINQTLEQMAQAIFKSWFVDFEPVKAKIAALEAGGSEDDALLAAMQVISGKDPQQLTQLQTENPEHYAILRATAALFPAAMQESELGEIPEGWKVGTLSDFCEFQNGYAFKGKDWADSGFPVVKIGSVKPGFVDLTKASYVSSKTVHGLERFELKAGDILVGMTGYPGETGLVPNYADRVFLNQRVGRFIPNEKYLYAYIFLAVRGSEFKVFVESQAHGSAQANVSGKAILQYPLISGSNNLMMRLYEVVNPQIQQMICLNAECSQLAELRDTLLPKLLSGELGINKEVS